MTVLPANVRLDWKVIARYKHSSLFGLVVCNEGNKFYNIDTRIIQGAKVAAAKVALVADLERQGRHDGVVDGIDAVR
jgi:hypothetical protein